MARGKLDINVRLERQEKKILKLTAELEAAKDEYDNLLKEKKEADNKHSQRWRSDYDDRLA